MKIGSGYGPHIPTGATAPEGPESTDHPDGFLLVGFDGSQGAATAIAVAGHLLPGRHARVAHLWTPPDAGSALHRRLAPRAWTKDDLNALVRREAAEASKNVVAGGVALAKAADWTAEPLVRGVYGNAGFTFAHLAEELRPAAVVVGSRGLGGLRGLLGSVSDYTVHHSPVPVLIVPPLLAEERAATVKGPVIVAHDGSAGADRARTAALDLFPGREHLITQVEAPLMSGSSSPADTDPGLKSDDRTGAGLPSEAVTLVADGWGPRAVADALAGEAAACGAGVVVVGSRGRSMLREVLLGSHARAMLHYGHRPVLVVPPVPA